jgi:hypothetical protein
MPPFLRSMSPVGSRRVREQLPIPTRPECLVVRFVVAPKGKHDRLAQSGRLVGRLSSQPSVSVRSTIAEPWATQDLMDLRLCSWLSVKDFKYSSISERMRP